LISIIRIRPISIRIQAFPMMKGFPAVLAGLVVAAVAAGGGYWYGARNSGAPAAGSPAAAAAPKDGKGGAASQEATVVEVSRVAAVALPQTITAVGSLRSDESVTLRPEIAGRITEILFEEGRPVSKGDLLVRLDQSITQAEARQARANLTLARAKYERSVDLAGRHFISGQAKDEARKN